jgi:hypothetical protein
VVIWAWGRCLRSPFVGGIAGFGGVGGYGNTAEGELIAAALLDSFNKLVGQIEATQAQPVRHQGRPQRLERHLYLAAWR